MTSEVQKAGRPVALLTRQESFSAAHRLWADSLSDAENRALYGPCANEYGHGHDYVLEVTVKGAIDPATGMVINLTDLRDAMRELVVSHVDHHHLNHDVAICKGLNPTTENLAVLFWDRLGTRFPGLLDEVRLRETPKNWVVYRGERT
ncbi:MAG: 6-carboxytetrahydropterin synthase [Sphingomonadaceae bacterium]|nr:6-carboxytetrahydropterin synthase [Sphingomonadaceae bacterium]